MGPPIEPQDALDAGDGGGEGREGGSAPDHRGRLLAEAARVFEELHGAEPEGEPDPGRPATPAGGPASLEALIVRRAQGLAAAAPLAAALERLGQTLRGAFLAGVLLAACAGAGTAHASLGFGRDDLINVFVVLGALLVPQTAFLLLALALLLLAPAGRAAGSLGTSLGGAVLGLAQRWFGRFHRGVHQTAAASAWSEVLLRSPLGKWTVGALSNGLWLAFDIGALAALLFLLSTRHYQFVWETTILARETFAAMVRAAGALPHALGFEVPDRAVLDATLWRGTSEVPSEAARRAWSGFVIGCLCAYGLLPRLAFFALCLGLRGRAARRYRLDLSRPAFARLRARLQPAASRLGVVDPEERGTPRDAAPTVVTAPETARDERGRGDPAVVGLELEAPASGWPPPLDGVRWHDLGRVDDGHQRRAALAALASVAGGAREPSHLVFVCALTTTPDRGVRGFVDELGRAVRSRRVLVLTGGQALRRRGDAEALRTRVEDWRGLAREAGIEAERTVELDLEHLTPEGAQRLLAALDRGRAESSAVAPGRRLEQAFARIQARSAAWSGAPTPRELAELQRELAELYGSGGAGLRALLRLPAEAFAKTELASVEALGARLGAGARRTLELLPPRLQASPRWIVAGAVGGAAACLAAALVAGPAALVALPSWSAVGGALGGVLRLWRKEHGGASAEARADSLEPAFGDAVRAAALQALLLELHGRGEERITRLLDAALPADEGGLAGPADVGPWLEGVRRRLGAALAAEARA